MRVWVRVGSGSVVRVRVRTEAWLRVRDGVRSGSGVAWQVACPVGVARVGMCQQHGVAGDGVWVDVSVGLRVRVRAKARVGIGVGVRVRVRLGLGPGLRLGLGLGLASPGLTLLSSMRCSHLPASLGRPAWPGLG